MSTDRDVVWERVRQAYGAVAGGGCCGGPKASAKETACAVGYSPAELASVPEGANLGLGCGNPLALAALRPGETVVDLGSGAGLDALLAAQAVGPEGRVIGVDMTPEMLARARENARKAGLTQVEFRAGQIEALPVADASADVVISNCVINLSPEKDQAFREAFRVLRPGGRLMVSDLVLLRPLPPAARDSVAAYVACVAGAALLDDYLAAIRRAGFGDVQVVSRTSAAAAIQPDDPMVQAVSAAVGHDRRLLEQIAESVVSVKVQAHKP